MVGRHTRGNLAIWHDVSGILYPFIRQLAAVAPSQLDPELGQDVFLKEVDLCSKVVRK
jgi:hypothetical protein